MKYCCQIDIQDLVIIQYFKTVLGWTVSGKTPVPVTSNDTPQASFARGEMQLETHLDRFWEVDAVEHSTLTPEQCEEHFVAHTSQQEDGR
jgi:hypothetical protein